MKIITAQKIHHFLYNKENGFLIQYHFNKGIDPILLDEFYEILETLKKDWMTKDNIPKDLVFYLVSIVPLLYRDLEIYRNDELRYYQYDELIYAIDAALAMCFNPDIDDPHFNTPLKELGL